VEWQTILTGILGASPVAAVLGYVAWNLWAKLLEKDRELQELNAQVIAMLLEVAKKDDPRPSSSRRGLPR
jgi:hypothetical protein